MKLIVGLGNPGKKYSDTWHNLGARVVQELARRWKIEFRSGRGECIVAIPDSAAGATLLIPVSYMNRSGEPVSSWMRYYHINPAELLTIFDDHDLPLGRIRLRASGSAAGHRGMEDVIARMGTDQIPRLRIGIRTDREHPDLANQVLSKIPKKLNARVEAVIQTAADAADAICRAGLIEAMSDYNGIEIA